MQRIILVVIMSWLGLFSAAPAIAQTAIFPQTDFFLYLGVRQTPADPLAGPRIERILFSSLSIDVRNEKISAVKTIPIHFTKGSQDFDGTASIEISGAYDKTTGQLTGSFTITKTIKDVWHGAAADLTAHWTANTAGTFSGQVVDNNAIIRFKGQTNEIDEREMADQSIKTHTETTDYLANTVWRLSIYQTLTPPAISELDQEYLDEQGNTVDSGSRFSGMTGMVEIHFPGTPEDAWTAVEIDMVIPVGARIRTKEESTATLGFSDMSTFILKPETQIIIPKPAGKENKLGLVTGNLWLNIKKLVKDGTMELDTLQAAAGVKGTTLIAAADNDKTIVKLIEGAIWLKPANDNNTIELTSGQSATIDNQGRIATADFDIIAEQNSWDNAPQIDFTEFEKKLPADSTAAPAAAAINPTAQNQSRLPYFIIFTVLLLIVIGLIYFSRKKK